MTSRAERIVALLIAIAVAAPAAVFAVVFQGLPRGDDGLSMSSLEQVVWYAALAGLVAGSLALLAVATRAVVGRGQLDRYAAAMLVVSASFAVAMFVAAR